MLKYYTVYHTTIVKGYRIGTDIGYVIQEEAPTNEIITLTWDNLTEMYQKYGLAVGFNVWNFRRGRRISFFNAELFNRKTRDIKEWKEELDVILEIRYEENHPSISRIMNWIDGEKAIQYLVERGLSIVNNK